jgi:methyl-branched lipid omega-hydroxylase
MFDVARDPNPQVGYGAGGVHFCLGANLARREINAAFREVHGVTVKLPDLQANAPTVQTTPTSMGCPS